MTAKVLPRRTVRLSCTQCTAHAEISVREDDVLPQHRCRKTYQPAPFDRVEVAK